MISAWEELHAHALYAAPLWSGKEIEARVLYTCPGDAGRAAQVHLTAITQQVRMQPPSVWFIFVLSYQLTLLDDAHYLTAQTT